MQDYNYSRVILFRNSIMLALGMGDDMGFQSGHFSPSLVEGLCPLRLGINFLERKKLQLRTGWPDISERC